VGRLDSVSAAELQIDYELVRRSIVTYHAAPNLRHGAQALIVIILGEMIRREPNTVQEQRMAGYQRAHRMMERLERSLHRRAFSRRRFHHCHLCQRSADRARRGSGNHPGARNSAADSRRREPGGDHSPPRRRRRAFDRLRRALCRVRAGRPHASGYKRCLHARVRRAQADQNRSTQALEHLAEAAPRGITRSRYQPCSKRA